MCAIVAQNGYHRPMVNTALSKPRLMVMLVLTVAIGVGVVVQAQQRGGTPQTEKIRPLNTGPNPYRTIRDWAQLTLEARPWGGSNGVAIDGDGRSVWATDRCWPGATPRCLGSKAKPGHQLDAAGKEARALM